VDFTCNFSLTSGATLQRQVVSSDKSYQQQPDMSMFLLAIAFQALLLGHVANV